MKIRTIITVCLLAFAATGFSQQQECGTDEYLRAQLTRNPGMQAEINRLFDQIAAWIRNHPIDPDLHRVPVTIPVVFHVLYKNAGENISDAVIQEQVRITNNQLRRQAANYSATPQPFRDVAANTRIQIQLAQRDPNGRATTGIVRQSVTKTVYTQELNDAKQRTLGGADAWDTNRYLNVWICDVTASWLQPGWVLNGYATFPYETTTPANLHGIVMNYRNIGAGESRGGATFTHELGHFIGLEHIWGNANCGDDLVSDTPTQAALNTGCPTYPKTSACSGNGPNGDMFYNFMDYTNCQTMFTREQARRMWGFLNFTTRRSSLLRSDGLMPPNAVTRDYLVDFIPEYNTLPSWKAALAMVHSYAIQQCITVDEINRLVAAGRSARGSRLSSLPSELADGIFGLGLSAEEVLACYTPTGFLNNIINNGPVALIESDATTLYGMVISGMRVSGNNAVVVIEDPMNIGPRQFGLTLRQDGHQKIASYNDLMTNLENAVINGKRVYMVRLISRI